MDFRYLLGGSELLGTHSLVEDIQRELQELRKRRQDLSSKLNAFALEFTEIEKREEELLGKLQHSPAPQEASSSVQYKMEPPMMPSHSTNHNNALSNCHLQQILGVVAGNTFSVGSALDTDTLDYASHDTPAADVTSLSAASERAHVPLDCSNAAVASATRKRPASSANSSVGKQATNKKKLSGISFEELSGHVANFHSLHDQTTGVFKCPVCGAKKAPKRYNTIRHLLSHLGDRSYHPYKCPVEGCDASSVAIDDMQKHVVNVHKLQWTNELKTSSEDADKKALWDSLIR